MNNEHLESPGRGRENNHHHSAAGRSVKDDRFLSQMRASHRGISRDKKGEEELPESGLLIVPFAFERQASANQTRYVMVALVRELILLLFVFQTRNRIAY